VFLDVVYALLLREFQTKSGKTRLGIVWIFVEPLAQMLWPIVLFSYVFGRHIAGFEYAVYLLYGLIPFHLFRALCFQTMDGVSAARGVMSYRPVHLLDVVLARAIATLTIEIIIFGLIGIGLGLLGYQVIPDFPVEWVATVVGAVSFGLGLGMILSAVVNFVPETRSGLKIVFIPLYIASGVAIPLDRFPPAALDYLAYNPLLHWIEAGRLAVNRHYLAPVAVSGLALAASALIPLFIGMTLYRLRQLNKVPT